MIKTKDWTIELRGGMPFHVTHESARANEMEFNSEFRVKSLKEFNGLKFFKNKDNSDFPKGSIALEISNDTDPRYFEDNQYELLDSGDDVLIMSYDECDLVIYMIVGNKFIQVESYENENDDGDVEIVLSGTYKKLSSKEKSSFKKYLKEIKKVL